MFRLPCRLGYLKTTHPAGRLLPGNSANQSWVIRTSGHIRRNSISQRPGSDHVHFPGAVNSKFTSNMDFIHPAENTAIPTYRVMDSDGVILDPSHESQDLKPEDILTWYKNMVSGRRYA